MTTITETVAESGGRGPTTITETVAESGGRGTTTITEAGVARPPPRRAWHDHHRGGRGTITTTAAVVESAGAPFTLADVVLGAPRPDEVLVRMVADRHSQPARRRER